MKSGMKIIAASVLLIFSIYGSASAISLGNNITIFDSSEVGGLTGDSHNAVSVDLGFLDHGTTFTSHFTMGCGNDNLMGEATLAPEPATMALFGIGLIGLAGIGRKKLGKVKP